MGGVSFFGLFLLFLLVGIAAMLMIALVVARRGRVTTPSCGKCGYAVAGLKVLRCPECGSDLRQVGIVTERMQRGLNPVVQSVLLAVGWTILLPIPAFILTAITFDAVPRTRVSTLSATLTTPDSQLYRQIDIDVIGRARATGAVSIPYQTATLILTESDGTPSAPIEFDLQSLDAGQTAADLLVWMGNSNLNVEDEALAKEANAIAGQLQVFASSSNAVNVGTFRSVSVVSSGMQTEPISPWYMVAAIAFWLFVWLAPIIWIIRRGVRRHRAESSAAPSS